MFKASRGIEDIYELTYIRKDGSRFPAVVSVTALRDERDKIIGYLLIGTDNSARKRAEEALLQAGALQSAIFNSANFSSIATDEKGVIQIFNVGAERMLGYAAADVMNKITPADISDPQEVIARAKALSAELGTLITPGFEALVFKASRGIEDIYELTYIRKDGSRFPAVVSVTALRDAQSGIIGYLLIGTDNTARKQIEAEQKKLDQRLRDQQFYTRSLIESNIDALMTTDPRGIITDVNKQMEALTGSTRDELIGAPFKNYFTDPERAEAAIKLVLSEKKVTNYELTARARDGKTTVVSYNATTFYDRERMLQGVFAAARDVTERKRFEQALFDSEKLAATGRLAASIAHEINNPLEAIQNALYLLVKRIPEDDPNAKFLAIAMKETERMSRILRQMLGFYRPAEDLAPTDLNALIEEAETLVAKRLSERNVQIEKLLDPALPKVMASADQIKQVILNLVLNAAETMTKGGLITVTTESHHDAASGFIRTDAVRVQVADTGPGISEEYLAHIFEPFFSTKGEKGTGLGLWVSLGIAQSHGGRLQVRNRPGGGTVFSMTLPIGGPPADAS